MNSLGQSILYQQFHDMVTVALFVIHIMLINY